MNARTRNAIAAASCAALISCGGGGGGGQPSAAVPVPTSTPKRNTTSVALTIHVPKSTTGNNRRRPFYVSTNTQSLVVQQLSYASPYTPVGSPVIANLTPTSPGCTSDTTGVTCAVSFNASPGTFNFSIQSFSGTNGTGTVLAENTLTTATVVSGVANQLTVTLNGVVGSLTSPPSVAATTTAPEIVNFSVQDPSGATIIGTGTYDNGPVTVTDLNGNTTESPSSFAGPNDASSFTVRCNAVGNGTLQFADATGTLGTMTYACTRDQIILTPGYLEFEAVAASSTDPTYDQTVNVDDINTNITLQTPVLTCTPGTGATLSTIATVAAGAIANTYAVRPLDVGSCTLAIQDTLGDGSTSTSQAIPIDIHTTTYVINSRGKKI